jgi:hypothetical protein
VKTWAVTNEEQARYWNGDEAAHWLVHEERHGRMGAPFTGHLLTKAAIGRADRVVAIGCGTGSTTQAAGGSPSTWTLRWSASSPSTRSALVHRFTPGCGWMDRCADGAHDGRLGRASSGDDRAVAHLNDAT